jgi:ubiquinone/menaquinone biosynthesis C-methylase UbiE
MIEINDSIYKQWYETYIKSTSEKELVEQELIEIVQNLKSNSNFLDIGPGDGSLTFVISKYFQNTTVIEPNKEVRENFKINNVEFIQGYFEDIKLENREFDYILCSHVFWLVKRDKQKQFINKILNHLSPEGRSSIIMVSPIGQSHDFHKKFFYDYSTTTHTILEDLHEMGITTEVRPVRFQFKSKNFEDFFNICKLFTLQSWLHPVNVNNEQLVRDIGDIETYTNQKLKEIEEYIKKNCYKKEIYIMDEDIDILTFSGRKL